MLHRRHMLALDGAAALAAPSLVHAQKGPIKIRDLYKEESMADLGLSLEGDSGTFDGFMAPPLKAGAKFFVLTKRPTEIGLFCEISTEWPDDSFAIYPKRTINRIPFDVGIDTSGMLEIGEDKDPRTIFAPMVRLADATHER